MRRIVLVLVALGAIMLAAPSLASAANTALTAKLTGKKEVPGPGDANGRGHAFIVLDRSAGQVCFALSWNRIGTPVAAHIHRGTRKVAGPIVVPLFSTPTHAGCVSVSAELLREIKDEPKAFYVNIHTAAFPAGAIRGQLKALK